MEVGIACKWLCVTCRGGMRVSFHLETVVMMYMWICGVWWGGCGGALTFEIKLVDVFQRLVDKEETSESLKEEKYL